MAEDLDVRDRFQRIIALTASTSQRLTEGEVEHVSPEEQLAKSLSSWASRKDAELFIQWLIQLVEGAKSHQREQAVLEKHPVLAYWLGVEDALSTIKQSFHKWAGRS